MTTRKFNNEASQDNLVEVKCDLSWVVFPMVAGNRVMPNTIICGQPPEGATKVAQTSLLRFTVYDYQTA